MYFISHLNLCYNYITHCIPSAGVLKSLVDGSAVFCKENKVKTVLKLTNQGTIK